MHKLARFFIGMVMGQVFEMSFYRDFNGICFGIIAMPLVRSIEDLSKCVGVGGGFNCCFIPSCLPHPDYNLK